MVEAAGVEPLYSIHSRQVVHFRNGKKSLKSMICKSTVQTLYKNLRECQESQTATRASKHLTCELKKPTADDNRLDKGPADDMRLVSRQPGTPHREP